MKKLSFFLLLSITVNLSYSQDLITKKSGEDIKVKVLEVATSEIKYRKSENLNGPIFTILKSEVLLVRYENGSKDIFNEISSLNDNITKTQTNEDIVFKAKEDAKLFYKGNNSGSAWTAVTTILATPLFGLIPAAACSSSEPDNDNLNIPNPELMKNFQYNLAYKNEAHKIKKRKVWKSFGIGSGIWLLLTVLTNR